MDLGKHVELSRAILRCTCFVFTVTGVAVWFWHAGFGPGYYREYSRIKDRLAAIPGITVLDSGGNTDLTFEDIWARIRVRDRGQIALFNLTENSFSSARDLAISRIDHFSFRWQCWGYGGVVGRDGKPVRSMQGGGTLHFRGRDLYAPGNQLIGTLPVSIRTVQELIAHYDHVCAWLEEHQGKAFEVNRPDEEMRYLITRKP